MASSLLPCPLHSLLAGFPFHRASSSYATLRHHRLLSATPPARHCLHRSRSASSYYTRGGSFAQRTFANAMIERIADGQVQQMEEAEEEFCEVVSGLELILGEGDDAFDAYLVKAIKNNNGAAVLLLTDVFGFKDNDTRDFAYRLSCFGYNVLVPDLFRREPWSKDRSMNEYEDWRVKHPPDRVVKDIDTSAKWLLDEIAVAGVSKRLGVVGFCFGGGRLIEALARDTEGKFAAAVCFYGTRFDPSISTQIKAPVIFITGDNDHLSSVDVVRDVASNIKGSEARIYPGRGHAFAHRPQSREEDEDAEDAFKVMRSWLHDKLLGET